MTAELTDRIIVDRSPELLRGARPCQKTGRRVRLTISGSAGIPGDGSACALAQLISENFAEIRAVSIEGEQPTITTTDGRTVPFTIDTEMAEWIGRFDRGEPVEDMVIEFWVAD